MSKDFGLENRKYVIGGVAIGIIIIYIIRLFVLQIMSEDYKKNADSNAFLKKIEFPARGAITDRHGKLLVYNQHAYDIMVIMNEESGRLDTMAFCNALGITKEFFIKRMNDIKDRSKNPGYSRFTQQLFMSQLTSEENSVFQEKIYRFPGFYIQKRSIRQYMYPYAAHVLGDVSEVSLADIEDDDYYQAGDYIGKLGIEKYYEKELRGTKGVHILLRDAHGRIQGSYQDGKFDTKPIAGKDLTLGIDLQLQALGERLMQGKIGSIVAIEPATGEVLCMVSSPSYDPRLMTGRMRGKMHHYLMKDPYRPLLNRSIMGQSSGLHIQDFTGPDVPDRRHRVAINGFPMPSRILVPRTPCGMPRTRLTVIHSAGNRHFMQRIFLLGTVLYAGQQKEIQNRAGCHEHMARLHGEHGIRL